MYISTSHGLKKKVLQIQLHIFLLIAGEGIHMFIILFSMIIPLCFLCLIISNTLSSCQDHCNLYKLRNFLRKY